MELIMAVDRKWNIGYQNRLLFHIPDDLKRFKALSLGNIVIMGRNTLESLPAGRPLEGRVNIVMTRNKDYKKEGVIVLNSQEELLGYLEKRPEKAYLIGGEILVRDLLHLVDRAHITMVDSEFKSDRSIPDLESQGFKVYESSEVYSYKDLDYKYIEYRR